MGIQPGIVTAQDGMVHSQYALPEVIGAQEPSQFPPVASNMVQEISVELADNSPVRHATD